MATFMGDVLSSLQSRTGLLSVGGVVAFGVVGYYFLRRSNAASVLPDSDRVAVLAAIGTAVPKNKGSIAEFRKVVRLVPECLWGWRVQVSERSADFPPLNPIPRCRLGADLAPRRSVNL